MLSVGLVIATANIPEKVAIIQFSKIILNVVLYIIIFYSIYRI
jgi:hypothetical protein